jgi:hypothetical protein
MHKPERIQLYINQREESQQEDLLEILATIIDPKFTLPLNREQSSIIASLEEDSLIVLYSPYEHFSTNESTWSDYGVEISIHERDILSKNKKEIEKLSIVRKDSSHINVNSLADDQATA